MVQFQAQPPIFHKWVGGKAQLLTQYEPFLPKEFRCYREPFLGGGALFMALQPRQAVLSDLNEEVINAWWCVRDEVEDLILLLAEHQKRYSRAYYLQVRSLGKPLPPMSPVEYAARFIFLISTSFNGLWRCSSRGMNVSFGCYKNPPICRPELLRKASAQLQGVAIALQGYESVLETAAPGDFIFFDPPYAGSKDAFTQYNETPFRDAEHFALRNVFETLVNRGCQVRLANSDTAFTRELYKGFTIHTVWAARNVNRDGTKRGKVSEILVSSD